MRKKVFWSEHEKKVGWSEPEKKVGWSEHEKKVGWIWEWEIIFTTGLFVLLCFLDHQKLQCYIPINCMIYNSYKNENQ